MSLPSSPYRLPRVVRSLGWVALFTDVATEMAYPLLPGLLKSLGGGAQALGLMEGIAESTSAIVKWLSGRSSDSRPRKPFVLVGYALATVARPLLAIASSPWHVIAIRTTDRLGKGLRTAPRDALLSHAVPPERRGHAFGFHNMMDNLGAAVGPLLATALLRGFGWSLRTVLALTIVPGTVAVITIVRGVEEVGPLETAKRNAGSTDEANRPLPGRLRAYLALVALFTLGASADSFLLLRLSDLGLALGWLPVAWVSLNAAKALVNIPGGKLSDRLGRKTTQVAGWGLYALVYTLFPFAHSVSTTWCLFAIYGAYYGLTEGGEKALVTDLVPPAARGRAFGALHAITGLAVLPANAVFGALYARHLALAFWLGAGFAGAAALGLIGLRMEPLTDDG